MEQVFRIEIPVEAVDKTDTAALQQLESLLQKVYSSIKQTKSAAGEAFNSIEHGASKADAAMQDAAEAASDTVDSYHEAASAASSAGSQEARSAQTAASAAENLSEAVEEVSDSYSETGSSATQAGQKASSAFNGASNSADQFTQRIEKSNKTLRDMFKEKLKLTLAAIDKASPVLKEIWSSVKGLAAKTWSVAVRMKDFVTAPFRKLYNMINSPITLALSIVGVGFSASDVLSTYNDFEAGMSNVQALSGATGEEFARLKETAQELGETTSFSASEAAEGMKYLAMAGWETGEIIEAMPGLLNLAAAGATDLGTAADIVSDVMTAMGMSASEASRAADVFAKTATSTNTTIEGLGNTMKYAAPIAHSFGMSLEDVAALAGLMANAGIKGEMAGTAMRSSMLRMSSPTSDMVATMKKLGISFSDSSGKMKSMSEIVRTLSTAFTGLSDSEKLTYAQDLFGTEAASAWLGVINQGADAYDSLAQSLYNASGAAEDMANVQLDNLQGDITLLQSAVEGMKIDLVDKINPYLREGVQWITGKIPEITTGIGNLIDTGIAKATQLKEFLSGVFSSSEWANADGFAEKFFVAWDKIIAEPFNGWWNNGGQDAIISAMQTLGSSIGDVLHGIIVGIFAALKGESVDVAGLEITGIAAAAANMAKEFVSAFVENLNFGELVSEMPGFLSAGIAGMGAVKLGAGALKITKWVSQLKSIFGGVSASAASAAPAVASVGTQAAASAVGVGKAATVLGGLKTALAAIPVWGWVAAAAVTAAAIGIKAYTDAQEREREELLHFSDSGAEAAENYRETVSQINELGSTVDKIHEIEITIEQGKNNQQTITTLQAQLAEVKSREVYIEAMLASGTLTPEEIAAYQAELEVLQGKEVELNAQLSDERVRSSEVAAYVEELSALQSREETIGMELEKGVTGEQAQAYMDELAIIKSRKETITLELEGLGLTTLQIAYANGLMSSIENKTAYITVKMSESSLSTEQINSYVTELSGIATRQAEIDLQLTGASLTEEQVSAYKTELEGIKDRKAVIEAKMSEGGLSDTEISDLSKEFDSITTREAEITMMLSGQGLTQEQLGALCEELEGITDRKSEIEAQMSEAGMTESDIQAVADAMAEIGNKTAELNVSFTAGSLKTEDITEYNKQLSDLYGNLIELSGGQITQADVDAGRVTDEDVEQVKQTLQTKAATELIELETQVVKGRGSIDSAVSKRNEYAADLTAAQEAQDRLYTARKNLESIEAARAQLVAEDNLNWEKVENGQMSRNAYDDWYENTFMPGIWNIQDRYGSEVAPYATNADGLPVAYAGTPFFDWLMDGDFFSSVLSDIESAEKSAGDTTSAAQNTYDTQNAALVQQYANEKALIEGQTFQGSSLAGMSLEDVAKSYATLDEAGRQMFEDAVTALDTLNAQTSYITDDEKTKALDVVEIAAKAEVISNVQTQVQQTATSYQEMTAEEQAAFAASEEGAKQLQAVNEALASLGLEKIESLDDLNSALEQLSGIDLSSFTLDKAQAAFVALGGDASGCKTKIDAFKQSLAALDGKSATTHVYNWTHNYSENVSKTNAKKNANGGIYEGAMLSWVAEDGPEAIIPLGAKRRDRGIDLWLRAGEMLGIAEFADGGIMEPYAASVSSASGESSDDDTPKPFSIGFAGTNFGGESTFQISVAANPTFEIDGNTDPDTILGIIKSKQKELAEILGGAISDQLEDIVSNMA